MDNQFESNMSAQDLHSNFENDQMSTEVNNFLNKSFNQMSALNNGNGAAYPEQPCQDGQAALGSDGRWIFYSKTHRSPN